MLNEFTHGKQEKVSKSEFKEVLSHILLNSHMGRGRSNRNGEEEEMAEMNRFFLINWPRGTFVFSS